MDFSEIVLTEDVCEDVLPEKDDRFTHVIVSKVAYMIGVSVENFNDEFILQDVFREMDNDKNARIIRHLSILRTKIERNFSKISQKIRNDYKSLNTLPEYVPEESIAQLRADGISLFTKHHHNLNHYIIEINKLISERIGCCKTFFPSWVKWEYIKDLFIMPNGLTEEGIKAAMEVYYPNRNSYPFQMYINWKPRTCGSIIANDKKFLTIIYAMNDDKFEDFNRVSDASNYVKNGIYQFLQNAEKAVMIVDCENADVYHLCAMLQGLDSQRLTKISKIILVDDVHTQIAWKLLQNYTDIEVEHITTERVVARKSLVDIELSVKVCEEHFVNNIDSFAIVSSDSDYWGLVRPLSQAKFLFMVERESFSGDMKSTLMDHDIFYCYMEDFLDEHSDDIKRNALREDFRGRLQEAVSGNVNDILTDALKSTHISLSDKEKKQFLNEYIHGIRLGFDADGTLFVDVPDCQNKKLSFRNNA